MGAISEGGQSPSTKLARAQNAAMAAAAAVDVPVAAEVAVVRAVVADAAEIVVVAAAAVAIVTAADAVLAGRFAGQKTCGPTYAAMRLSTLESVEAKSPAAQRGFQFGEGLKGYWFTGILMIFFWIA